MRYQNDRVETDLFFMRQRSSERKKKLSKLNCPCGWQISNVGSPNDWTGSIINDNQRDQYFDDAAEDRMTDIDFSALKEIWECVECGRLAIDKTAIGREVIWFKPEDGKYQGILKGKK
jgi:hypothetical protein